MAADLEHWRIKCILNMFYFKCSSFADRGDNIKTNRNVYTEMLDICIGSHYNVAYFLPINSILRFDVFRIASDRKSVV